MKYGVVLPRGDARIAADFACEAEKAGWDGFFVWEPVWGIDAWVSLTAAAMLTNRIRLGTLLSPLSRMRPWKIASEAATLDNLSNGRVILSVGLGHVPSGFAEFGEVTERNIRAELLDEGLDIVTRLWSGHPFDYNGKHYQIKPYTTQHILPLPVQQPRIPIWVVGAWPRMKSMRRVVRWDGLLPAKLNDEGKEEKFTPEDIGAMKAYVDKNRTQTTPFDIIVDGVTPGERPDQAAATVRTWAAAGATWWIESMWETPEPEKVLVRIKQGPPML